MKVTRPALRWFGGKWIMSSWIVSHFPDHHVYLEPYGGGASVLLKKWKAPIEIYNDLDDDLVNLFRILRDPSQAQKLGHLVGLTPFSRSEYERSFIPEEDSIEQARKFLIRSYFGFGGGNGAKSPRSTGFRKGFRRSQSPADDWANWPKSINAFTDRLKGVTIEKSDALNLIVRCDTDKTLTYADPPYPHSTRSKRRLRNYKIEMTDEDHIVLSKVLIPLKGFVVLSSYPNPLYDRLYRKWDRRERKSVTNGRTVTKEILWLNRKASDALRGTLL